MKSEKLAAGLIALGPQFNAEICPVCEGKGEYPQTYTIGCGMGTYRSMGQCDWCNGRGLRQEQAPASASIVNQVLQAVEKAQKGGN